MNQNSPLSFSNIFKRETKLAAYFIICLTLVVLSVSYALFFSVDNNTANQEVTAGDLKFTYKNGNTISSTEGDNQKNICFQPMSDEEAELYWEECSYSFSVTNTGTLKASYSLSLSKLENSVVDDSKVKVILRKVENSQHTKEQDYPKALNTITKVENTEESSGNEYSLLKNVELAARATVVYEVQIYIDEKGYEDTMEKQSINYQINGSGIVYETEDLDPEKPKTADLNGASVNVVDEGNGLYEVPHDDAEITEGGG